MRKTFGIKTCTLLLSALLMLQLGLPAPLAYAATSDDVATDLDASGLPGDAPSTDDLALPDDDQEDGDTSLTSSENEADLDQEADDLASSLTNLDTVELDDETQEPTPDPGDMPATEEDLVVDEDAAEQEPINVEVQSSDTSGTIVKGAITVNGLNKAKELVMACPPDGSSSSAYVSVEIDDPNYDGGTLVAKSSNPSIAAIDSSDASQSVYGGWAYLNFTAKSVGVATITVTYTPNTGGSTADSHVVSFKVVCYPESVRGVTAKKASYNKVSVSWKQHNGVTGYKVYRAPSDGWGYATKDYKLVATIKGEATTSTTLQAAWDTEYMYEVRPYLTTDGKTYVEAPYRYDNYGVAYALPSPSVRITSIKKASAKKLKVTWKADKGATGFKVYRSTKENSGYSCIAKPKAGTTSYVAKANPGTIYYFKVEAVYGTMGNVTSKSLAQQIPVSSGSSTKAKSVGVSGLSMWYDARYIYTYVQGTNTYVAYLKNRTLTVVGYNKSLKRISKKRVKLDKYEMWGGIYHGPDNNNYVVTGSPNYKESKTKVVIRVTKYSSAWKKGKTASIKGGASNSYTGVYEPFRASGIALDMQGSTLYLMTGRTMFQTSDGLHHQSNIAFCINTKTMKATTSNISYASHSFGQKVRFKDGTLYVADHGDAYPRSMVLTWQDGYGTKQAQEVQRVEAFDIIGETGDNYTGASLGGMEVGSSTVLLCGTSVPQNYGVKGVKGADWNLQHNLYVTVTKRSGGQSTVKWLTTYHPKKKTGVTDARMVKLSDDRFGILYTVDNNGKQSLHYIVIDGNGKKIFTRTITGVSARIGTQPCYANGRITWASYSANGKAKLASIRAL
ncbi:MAG: hypothetical protein Q4A07_08250 [Coriobacteriales bacterium]|nr:hypothetical protein [Coriobacteriales bacterium]